MREIFIEKRENLIRIAVKEQDQLMECLVEEDSINPQIGEVYKARVKNIIPGINSVFFIASKFIPNFLASSTKESTSSIILVIFNVPL